MNVFLDTSPITNGHSHRGIGLYTQQLKDHLANEKQVKLVDSKISLKKTDIIHYPFFDLFFPTLPLIKPKAKTIVTIHDVIPLQLRENYAVGLKGKLSHFFQKTSVGAVDAVITDSLSSQRSIHKYLNIPLEKVHVVYLAGNPAIKKQSAAAIAKVAEQYKLPANYILYVGDINYNKNIPQLIKALKYIKEEIHLVLLGKNFRQQDIPEWQWIETQVALSDVKHRVKFISELSEDPNTDISAIYSAAKMYVQPSIAEGFGLPVLEAMQAETPVVCTNRTSLPEVAGPHAYYCDLDAESIADAVNEVLNFSPAKRKLWINQAAYWSSNFTWKKTAQQTIKVYQNA